MENDKNNPPKKKRGKRMYDIYCCSCHRELTSEEIAYWKKARAHEATMKCYYCLAETASIMKVELPFDYKYFGREIPFSPEKPSESRPEDLQSLKSSQQQNNPLDLGQAGFLKTELNYDPNEPVSVQRTKDRAGPFGTKAASEKLENSNLNITKITAMGSSENVSLTLVVPGDIPKELVPLFENGLNKFLAVIINTMAFAPMHSSVLKPFFKNGIDDNFDPGNMRFPWDN